MNPDDLNRFRVFNLSAQTFLPLLEEMQTNAFEKLIYAYRDGEVELVAQVAKVESLYALKEEIITKAKMYEHHASKETT